MSITLKDVTLEEVLPLIRIFEEFRHSEPHLPETYMRELHDKKHLILLAMEEETPAGFLIAFDKYGDGSIYCWRTGVLPQFRRKGILRTMMCFLEQWARKHHYSSLKLFTRNNRRAMLSFLVNEDFYFLEVIPKETVDDYRIKVEKML